MKKPYSKINLLQILILLDCWRWFGISVAAMAYQTHSAEETQALGAKMAKVLKPGDVLGLVGDLGSGKTCFVQGLARGLQVPSHLPIASPTFVLIHEYLGGRLPLYHFDFYRLAKEKEAIDLNLEEYFEGDGVCVVEWADNFPKVFPKTTEWIYFKVLEKDVREIRC